MYENIHNVNISGDMAYKYAHRNDAIKNSTEKLCDSGKLYATWKKVTSRGTYWYACSYCGHDIPRSKWNQDWFSNFCPNCGRKMYEE